jgi:5-methylthioadenosine/S-adenosylhomocysteine deaminase
MLPDRSVTRVLSAFLCAFLAMPLLAANDPAGPFDPSRGLLLRGTVVTMDDARTVVENGNVLVRDGRIVGVWEGKRPPAGVSVGAAAVVDLGPKALIFPGLINLHNHPTYNVLPLWPAPSSHVQADRGRPTGGEAYANRYQWNVVSATSPAEYVRLVENPHLVLTSPAGLNLQAEAVKYAEVKALLGGETALQGATPLAATDGLLARNVDNVNFGRDRVENRVASIGTLTGAALTGLQNRMRSGQVDAWLVHLAEGVRDGDRRPGDLTSSRAEFATLKSKGLLNDTTVILHGTALEPADFAEMRQAGAKLVWSPLSNLLLYGRTANVYDALAAGVLVSLGTDWSPSGSKNLLSELKVADIALRDPRILGQSRDALAAYATTGRTGEERNDAERALDELLVSMVTRNPARTLRWDGEVGSIEAGKVADLLVITRPQHVSHAHVPQSPYRNLIDASERDVRLVLVGGDPVAGDAELLSALKPGDFEVVGEKGIDVTKSGVPKGEQTFAALQAVLAESLRALGGDHPPDGGGPAPLTNTYSYLKARIPGGAPLTDAQFRDLGLVPVVGLVNGRINLEAIELTPVFTEHDDFLLKMLDAAPQLDFTPPFGLYPSNANHVGSEGNPLAAEKLEDRWYEP